MAYELLSLPSAMGGQIDEATRQRPILRSHRTRGFTLIELMTIVIIVGILATIAVVSYRKLVTGSHTTEAIHMVQAIRVAQEARKAEFGSYANVSTALVYATTDGVIQNAGSGYPSTTPGAFKTYWGQACGNQCNSGIDWSTLPLHTDGPVAYAYSTTAGNPGDSIASMTLSGNPLHTIAFGSPTTDWYVVSAVGDVDSDSIFSTVITSSFNNDVLVDNEGE